MAKVKTLHSSDSLNRNSEKIPSELSLTKQNYDVISLGNRHGHIAWGGIHQNGDVTAGITLQTNNAKHSFTMDSDGGRSGWTTLIQPGNFSLTCGTHPNIEDPKQKASLESLVMTAENGNITIRAKNGKIRLEGDDIELCAKGNGTSQGYIKLEASQKIRMDANIIEMDSKEFTKIFSTGVMTLTGKTCLEIYGSIIRGVSDAVKVKDSKNGHKNMQKRLGSLVK